MTTTLILLPYFIFHLLVSTTVSFPPEVASGQWQLLQKSIGIVSMHMQLLNNDRVIIFDRTDFGLSNLTLPNGRCRHDRRDQALKIDCTAHSVEYDVASNTFRALFVQTDVWCSSGSVVSDGTLIQTGGYNDGERVIRSFVPCSTCDWQETNNALAAKRWYATNHLLPDGRQIIIGGRRQFNYEFYPKMKTEDNKPYVLPFLSQTYDRYTENNLYPFVFLNVDGNLFIFANNRAILFNYQNNTVVRTYPEIPGGDPRCYPSTGSAVLLPLRNLDKPNVEAEVLVCGGARRGAYELLEKDRGALSPALDSCARIKITDLNATWVVETMPMGRVMNDMVMLPNGNVLIINGAELGTAGWERATKPVQPVIYKPNGLVGSRFMLQSASNIPRMYHSTTVLVRDGRVLVGGSNPHEKYEFFNVSYPTELSLEAFSPYYLDPQFSPLRPIILEPGSKVNATYGEKFKMSIKVNGTLVPESVSVTMLAPPFNTHSFSMNQRLLVLPMGNVTVSGKSTCEFEVVTPSSAILAPPAFYLLFAVHQDIPSEGIWIKMQ